MAVNGKVYDVTPYLNYHPGGAKQLLRGAGKAGLSCYALLKQNMSVSVSYDRQGCNGALSLDPLVG